LLQPRRVGVVCAISEPFAVNGFFWSIEQREVDRVAHLAVPAVAGVQPTAPSWSTTHTAVLLSDTSSPINTPMIASWWNRMNRLNSKGVESGSDYPS